MALNSTGVDKMSRSFSVHIDWVSFSIKFYYGLYVLFVILSSKTLGGSLLIDELLAFILTPFAIAGFLQFSVRSSFAPLFMILYFLFYLISTVIHLASVLSNDYPIEAIFLGIALETKPFVFVFGFLYLFILVDNIKLTIINIVKFFVFFALINSLFALVDILRGQSVSLLGIPLMAGQFGLKLPNGLFNHKVGSAVITMLGCMGALALNRKRQDWHMLVIAGYLFLILVLHGSVKELLCTLFAFALFMLVSDRGKSGRTPDTVFIGRFGAALSLIIILTVFSQLISANLTNRYEGYFLSHSVRGMLYEVAAQIAWDRFPFGSGAATYASAPSRTIYYSDIYHQYGLSRFYGASPIYSSYLMDTWWPKILGESGFFGFIAYLGFWAGGFIRLARNFVIERDGASFFLFSAATAVMVSSLAASVFTSDVYLPVIGLVWAVAYFPRQRTSQNQSGRVI